MKKKKKKFQCDYVWRKAYNNIFDLNDDRA